MTVHPRPSPRRSVLLLVAGLVLASMVAATGLGSAPAGAGVSDPCQTEDQATRFVCATYRGFMSRPPSDADLAYWVPRVPAQRTFFTATVARSTESRRFSVRLYYQRFSDSDPSEADLQYWAPKVTVVNGMRSLEAALLASLGGTVDDFVEDTYDAMLRRAPSAPELVYWSDRAEATTRTKVAAELSNSLEVRRARVKGVYNNDLGQTPDEPGRAYWAERLRTGGLYLDLRIAVRSSPDGYATAYPCPGAAAPAPGYVCV